MKRIFFFMAIAVFAAFLQVSCKSGNGNSKDEALSADIVKNPNTADGTTDSSKLPVFKFEEEIHDFGRVIQGEKISYSFKFKNVGKADLVITNARGSCGCTIADYPKTPLAPNADGVIDVTFNTENKKGYQNKTITIIANTQPNTKVLTIKAQVQVPEGESKE